MATITQKQLFGWEEIDILGDLDRLRLALEYIPDEPLMQKLEEERGRGRNDYPVRAVWNAVIAGIVYQHVSIESLRRELSRNGQLRQLCGFNVLRGEEAIPPASVFTRFLRSLMRHDNMIEAVFDQLVEELAAELPGFGKCLAVDGKAISSHARKRKDMNKEPDGRRDVDADTGIKRYHGQREDGTLWEKLKSWFGYKLHLVVDAEYELPVGYQVTRASAGEQPIAHKLLEVLQQKHKQLLKGTCYWSGDKGYDDGKLLCKLWDQHEIKPVVDIRDCWQDGEKTRLVEGRENVVYDYRGNVYCHCPASGEIREMAYGGFEKERETLKYRCPGWHYGLNCKGEKECDVGKAVRIKLSEDRRVFTPLARSSYAWRDQYNKRTAVERVNSRLDVSFGFENHYIRGLKKMKLRCGLAMIVMLGMALGRVKEKQKEKLRSLVAA